MPDLEVLGFRGWEYNSFVNFSDGCKMCFEGGKDPEKPGPSRIRSIAFSEGKNTIFRCGTTEGGKILDLSGSLSGSIETMLPYWEAAMKYLEEKADNEYALQAHRKLICEVSRDVYEELKNRGT